MRDRGNYRNHGDYLENRIPLPLLKPVKQMYLNCLFSTSMLTNSVLQNIKVIRESRKKEEIKDIFKFIKQSLNLNLDINKNAL